MYESLKYFCTFIGYTRSGHSIVGSILDAHPHAIIAHEMDVFSKEEDATKGKLLYKHKEELFEAIMHRSQHQAAAGRLGGRIHQDGSIYTVSYEVPDQFHGTFTELKVIGNKRGQVTCKALKGNPNAISDLAEMTGLPVKTIHVIRNPYDNIATMTAVHKDRSVVRYFTKAEIVRNAKERGIDILDVYLEELIRNPRQEIRRMCQYLDLEPTEDYLTSSAAILFKKPNKTRFDRPWAPAELRLIKKRMSEFPWLRRYRFLW